jgi:hypothetical protein
MSAIRALDVEVVFQRQDIRAPRVRIRTGCKSRVDFDFILITATRLFNFESNKL